MLQVERQNLLKGLTFDLIKYEYLCQLLTHYIILLRVFSMSSGLVICFVMVKFMYSRHPAVKCLKLQHVIGNMFTKCYLKQLFCQRFA